MIEALRLAPSAHNTQPWRLCVTGPTTFRVAWDLDRWLDVADPSGEHLGYSLGAAIEAASSVAAIEYEPSSETDLLAEGGYAGDVRIKGAREGGHGGLDLVRKRQTNRAPFGTAPPPSPQLRELERQAESAGLGLSVLSGRPEIRRLASLTAEGATACLRDDGYLQELLRWLRLSRREPDWDQDGFTPETLLLDPLTARLLRWLKRSAQARRVASRIGMPWLMGLKAGAAVRSSGALLLLTSEDRSAQGFIRGGRVLMRLWLTATREALAVQPVHFPLSLDSTRSDALRLFGVGPSSWPIALIRIGYARRQAPPSSRLPLHRICSIRDLEAPE